MKLMILPTRVVNFVKNKWYSVTLSLHSFLLIKWLLCAFIWFWKLLKVTENSLQFGSSWPSHVLPNLWHLVFVWAKKITEDVVMIRAKRRLEPDNKENEMIFRKKRKLYRENQNNKVSFLFFLLVPHLFLFFKWNLWWSWWLWHKSF